MTTNPTPRGVSQHTSEQVSAEFERWYPDSGVEGCTSEKVSARFGFHAGYKAATLRQPAAEPAQAAQVDRSDALDQAEEDSELEGTAEPVAQAESVACWRYRNALGEVVSEWIDGAPPEKLFDPCGNELVGCTIEVAYSAQPLAVPDAADSGRVGDARYAAMGRAFCDVLADPNTAWRNTGAKDFIGRVCGKTAALEAALAAQGRGEAKCFCDQQGIGDPKATCGDCPRDYKAHPPASPAGVTDVVSIMAHLPDNRAATRAELIRAFHLAAAPSAPVEPAGVPDGVVRRALAAAGMHEDWAPLMRSGLLAVWPIVPDGYVLVPREPTPEMIAACIAVWQARLRRKAENGTLLSGGNPAQSFRENYVAMLAAAPSATPDPTAPTDDRILWGVVANAGRLANECKVRWSHVSDATALGSQASIDLCRRFGFDPDEERGEFPSAPEGDGGAA